MAYIVDHIIILVYNRPKNIFKIMNNSNIHHYITTPIYYINDLPHIGHAYTSVICDVYARFQRMTGCKVFFVTGTDEHGQKIAKSALNKEMPIAQYVDIFAKEFLKLADGLKCSYDDFIRTTEKRHEIVVCDIWNRLLSRGHIYLDKYAGFYSVRDEAFYGEDEIVDGLAPTGSAVEWVEEESYFFDLSKWQEPLMEFYEQNPNFIYPKSRFNEVKSFVKGGLRDLSISRKSVSWGIKVPDNNKHTIYVWIDALSNYLTTLKFPDESNELYRNFWNESDNALKIHVIGKDILRFHAVYWPAILMAAELPLPSKLIVHGWWMADGQKMSKSIGNVVNPFDVINQYGLDTFRCFMITAMKIGNDGNFTLRDVTKINNTVLADIIGNLLSRTMKLIGTYFDYRVPDGSNLSDQDIDILNHGYDLPNLLIEQFQEFDLNESLNLLIRFAHRLNQYFSLFEPWILVKKDLKAASNVLYTAIESIRILSIMLYPFIPDASLRMMSIFSMTDVDLRLSFVVDRKLIGKELLKPLNSVLFQKIDLHGLH